MKLPEPVGAVYTINGLRHCTLTQEPSETDLFTAAQMIEYRNQALDEAAQKQQEIVHDPAEIRRVFEIDEADYPPPDSGFAKL